MTDWLRIWTLRPDGGQDGEMLINLHGVRSIERARDHWKVTFHDGNSILRSQLELVTSLATRIGVLAG